MKKLLSALTIMVLAVLLVACGPKTPANHEVTFDSAGGSAVGKKIVEHGGKLAKPTPDPIKDGFTFKFWMNGTTEFDFNTEIKEDLTLTANWEVKEAPVVEKVIVTFYTDGGTEVANQEIDKGSKVVSPTVNPTKTGYVFKHWALLATPETPYDFNAPVTEAITLIAKWDIQKYTVTFDSNGGSDVPAKNVEYNTVVEKPSNPTKDGFIFKHWELEGVEYDFKKLVTSNITLKAVWEEVPAGQFVVSFNTDGGTPVPANQTVTEGELATKPADNPVKAGYTFEFWSEDGTKEFKFTTTIEKATNLKAVWKANDNTIKFDLKGGSPVEPNQIKKSGEKVDKPSPDPTKEGFVFKHWAIEGSTTAYDFESTVLVGFTLVAIWDVAGPKNELVHNYDFSTLEISTAYVTEETNTEVKDLVTNSNGNFVRMNANISKSGDGFNGVVLAVREGNGWEDPYITTPKLEGIYKVQFVIHNWQSDQYFQTDYAKNVFVQTSTDGITWNNEKDIKADLNTEQFGVTTVSLELDGTPVFVRLYIVSNGAQPSAGTNEDGSSWYRQYRLIVSDFKAWN